MAWSTLYITGRPGFDEAVLNYFKKSHVDFLTGSFNEDGLYLYWITEDFILKNFKKTIGSKVIFKYRLRFFLSVDTFVASENRQKRNHHFTPDQEQMFRDLG